MTSQTELDKFVKLGIGLLAWATLIWMLSRVALFFNELAVFIGFVVLATYLLLGPVNGLERWLRQVLRKLCHNKGPFYAGFAPWLRTGSILFVYLVFLSGLLWTSLRFVPLTIGQLEQFTNQLPLYAHQAEEWAMSQRLARPFFRREMSALKLSGHIPQAQQAILEAESRANQGKQGPLSPMEKQVIRENLFDMAGNFNTFLVDSIRQAVANVVNVIGSTLTGFIYALTGLVLVFYFLLDGRVLKSGFIQMLPTESQETADFLLERFHGLMFGFIKGQVLLAAATGVFMVLVYWWFEVPYAIFLGTFFGLAGIIPLIGPVLGFIPGAVVLLSMSPWKFFFVMLLVYAFHVIKDNVVAPRVMGRVMGLHPVMVIVSLLACAKMAGLVGVLYAIPLASMANVLVTFLRHRSSLKTEVLS